MFRSASIRWGVLAALVAVMFAGCGGAQNGMVTPVTSAQGRAHRASGSGGDLLYTIGFVKSQGGFVRVYTYPQGDLTSRFWLPGHEGRTACSDNSGNVFFPAIISDKPVVYEYAHGATTPSATLDDSDGHILYANGCAVDPVTGNLAIANSTGGTSESNIAIFTAASGSPTFYYNQEFGYDNNLFCSYDGAGNLFVIGFSTSIMAELPHGAADFTNVTVSGPPGKVVPLGQIQWDGQYLAMGPLQNVYRVTVSGSTATVVGKTPLINHGNGWFWIQGDTIIDNMTPRHGSGTAFWHYPKGKKPYQIVSTFKHRSDSGTSAATVSVAPTHK